MKIKLYPGFLLYNMTIFYIIYNNFTKVKNALMKSVLLILHLGIYC